MHFVLIYDHTRLLLRFFKVNSEILIRPMTVFAYKLMIEQKRSKEALGEKMHLQHDHAGKLKWNTKKCTSGSCYGRNEARRRSREKETCPRPPGCDWRGPKRGIYCAIIRSKNWRIIPLLPWMEEPKIPTTMCCSGQKPWKLARDENCSVSHDCATTLFYIRIGFKKTCVECQGACSGHGLKSNFAELFGYADKVCQ